jgi:hypothetical protein
MISDDFPDGEVVKSGAMETDTSGAEPDNKCPVVSPHPWKDLRISRVPKKRGRPKGKDKVFSVPSMAEDKEERPSVYVMRRT